MGMGTGGSGGLTSEINVTPMVDIMLVLLIIFMVITPLLQSGVSVALPKNTLNPEEDPAIIKESSVVISVTSDNKIYIGKDQIDSADLADKIQKRMENKKPEERIVYLKSDINADYGSVVDVINSIRKAGIDQIGLVADKKKGPPGAAAPPVQPAA